MKKIHIIFAALFVLVIPNTLVHASNISSSQWYQANVNRTSQTVGQPITLQVVFTPNGRGCAGNIAPDRITISASNGATISKRSLYTSYSPVDGPFTYETVNIIGVNPGVSAISLYSSCKDGDGNYSVDMGPETIGNVTFTSPATVGTTTQSNTTSQSQSTTTTPAVLPETPKIDTLKLEGNLYQETSLNQYVLGDTVTFSGVTIPNGEVHLYFQSEPFEATTTAGSDGKWSYELTRDIGEGEHTLQIAVKDPTTNQLSEKSAAARFTLVASSNSTTGSTTKVTTNYFWWYVIGGLLLLVIIASGVAFYLIRKKRNKSIKADTTKIPE